MQSALKDFFHPLESTSNARDKFYNKFKREAEDYDKEFSDKYGGDLDTTLIFVCLPLFLSILVVMLNWLLRTGCFVLRRRIRVHHRHPDPAPTRLHTIELRSPLDDGQFHAPGSSTQAQ